MAVVVHAAAFAYVMSPEELLLSTRHPELGLGSLSHPLNVHPKVQVRICHGEEARLDLSPASAPSQTLTCTSGSPLRG